MGRPSLRNVNAGNLLVVLGMGWLGFSFWLPYGTADRVFRIENRTARTAREFTLTAAKLQKIDWDDTATRDQILAAVNLRCGNPDPESSLHLRATEPPSRLQGACMMFADKHYLYMLTNPPARHLGERAPIQGPTDAAPPVAAETGLPTPGVDPVVQAPPLPLPEERLLPFETYAWPKNRLQGVRTVFMSPSDGPGVYTRNLSNRYIGPRKAPQPGDGRRDISSEKQENDYRGHDDERWIFQVADR